MATTPWNPASLLTVTGKDEKMSYRWVRLNNLDKSILEGWEPVRSINKGKENAPFVTLNDGTKIDGIIRKRNLILCITSKEVTTARSKYYQSKTDALLESSVREYETAAGGKKQVYGKIEVGK